MGFGTDDSWSGLVVGVAQCATHTFNSTEESISSVLPQFLHLVLSGVHVYLKVLVAIDQSHCTILGDFELNTVTIQTLAH